MMTKGPNFFILGAPKCGTTSLARWLGAHPEIFMSPIKEPHYFSTDLANRSVKSRRQYDRLFRDVTDAHRAVGEASTWYLYSRDAVPAIERELPNARYIVMTRDPVQMAHSLYHHNLRVLHEDQPTFERAWLLQEERARGQSIPSTCAEPAFLQYRDVCALGTHLQRLLDTVPADRILHLPLEAMQADTRREYQRVLSFLEVPDDGRNQFPVANEARGHRSRVLQRVLKLGGKARMALGIQKGFGLGRINDRPAPKAALSDEFVEELDLSFAREKALLARLTDELNGTEGGP